MQDSRITSRKLRVCSRGADGNLRVFYRGTIAEARSLLRELASKGSSPWIQRKGADNAWVNLID